MTPVCYTLRKEYGMDAKIKQSGTKYKVLGMSGAMGFVGGDVRIKRSFRTKSRTLATYNRKVNKLKAKYRKSVIQSQKSKDIFNKLSESEQSVILKRRTQNGKVTNKEFFCDKYLTFEAFLLKTPVREMKKDESKTSTSTFSRPKRPVGGWY